MREKSFSLFTTKFLGGGGGGGIQGVYVLILNESIPSGQNVSAICYIMHQLRP